MLTEEDFYADDGYDEQLVPKQEDYHIQYTIEMSKLAIIRKWQPDGIVVAVCQKAYDFQWAKSSPGSSVLVVT